MIILIGLVGIEEVEVRREFQSGAEMQEWVAQQENLIVVSMVDTEPDQPEDEQ